jgi:cobyric acid synthase
MMLSRPSAQAQQPLAVEMRFEMVGKAVEHLFDLLRFADGRADGAVSGDGLVTGTYVHGLFADDRQRAAWLARLGAAPGLTRYPVVSPICIS